MTAAFEPTKQQLAIIGHAGSAFVSACPGAGKTRVLVQRAQELLKGKLNGKGIAFLSFTNAAVVELEARLRQEASFPSPCFPHFIGTFDSFIWQFLVAPFGVPDCDVAPRLVPDKAQRAIKPFDGARDLALECFDLKSGAMIDSIAKRYGFDPAAKPHLTKAYVTVATKARVRFLKRGEVDFDDARAIAENRLADGVLSNRVGLALKSRFREVIVDEAQDCNLSDLAVIDWLHKAGIPTKVICDPHQSIYAFRGGVTEQLVAFGKGFPEGDRLPMTGNFRSSSHIAKAIVSLRPKEARDIVDEAVGPNRDDLTPVYILSYLGVAVPQSIGERFVELLAEIKVSVVDGPVLAATRRSGARAIGQPVSYGKQDLTLRLAIGVMDFHFSFDRGNRQEAMEELHRIMLELSDKLGQKTYHQHLVAEGIAADSWRPTILGLARALRYDGDVYQNADAWHAKAKQLLATYAPAGKSIAQCLKANAALAGVLMKSPTTSPAARTIHSVKGMEFPAVCVVMTTKSAKGILDFLETGAPEGHAEDARELYVAASRAQRLLTIACPKSQAERLAKLIAGLGATVVVEEL